MAHELTDCLCERRGYPPASFCDDDLYCSQCGGLVADLSSRNLQPCPEDESARAIWIYPTPAEDEPGQVEFRFSLRLDSLDRSRKPRQRHLWLDPNRVTVQMTPWFQPGLVIEPNP